MQELI